MLRTDSREHLSFQKPCPRNTCRSMKFVGTLARHPQPKFGVSGRVAIADAYEPVIRDRIVQLFRQRSAVRHGHARSRPLELEDANETCGERSGRTALRCLAEHTRYVFFSASRLRTQCIS